ncbi:MAG: sulfatase-like hydrolase/transferase [Verrucomicrobiota bacterium]|nr:sulfatase-like hydrolase/transferase [Verrucomicrobiota bacterium]
MRNPLTKLIILGVTVISIGLTTEHQPLRANNIKEKKTDKTRDPNIIIILADDVGYEGLSCYGGGSYPTKHLDSLAKSGLQAMHCYSMPVCHPTRIALLTGQYPTNVGNPKWGTFPAKLEAKTLARIMKDAGYGTVVSGKWQLALLKNDPKQPHRMGFDEYCVFGWHEGPRYHSPMIYENGSHNSNKNKKFGPDIYRQFLESFITKTIKDDKPFFAFYSMALCHDVTDDLKSPVPVSPSGKYLTYSEMVSEMDRQIGLLLEFLETNRIRNDTVLIFVTDNGTPAKYISHPQNGKLVKSPIFSELNGKRIQGGKGRLDDTGTRVPLIVSWPSVIKPDSRTNSMIDMTDFFATSIQLAGIKINHQIDGVSFLPLLRNKETQRTWAYSERKGKWWVRNQKYKLYNNEKFVEVSPMEPGKETEIKGPLNSEQSLALKRLKEAQPHRKNP